MRRVREIFWPTFFRNNFFATQPSKIFLLIFIFSLPPGVRRVREFFLPAFFRNNFFRGRWGYFLPGRRRNFLAGNPFLEIFCEGVGSFSTLEAILLYISSNVYRIDPKKRTLRAPKGYKTDFSQDIHITIQKKRISTPSCTNFTRNTAYFNTYKDKNKQK